MGEAPAVEHLHRVPGAVAQGQHCLPGGEEVVPLRPGHRQTGQGPVPDGHIHHLVAKADVRPQAHQLPPEVFQGDVELVCAGVGVGVNKDALRHAALHQLPQNPPVAQVPGAGVQLPVGEGPGAPLAELDVGGEVQHPGAPEVLHILLPLLHGLSPLQEDGPGPGLGQNQGAEQPCRPGPHHHGGKLRREDAPRRVITLADHRRDPPALGPAQELSLVFHSHLDRVDQRNALPGVHRAPDHPQGPDPALRNLKDFCRLAAQFPLRRTGGREMWSMRSIPRLLCC